MFFNKNYKKNDGKLTDRARDANLAKVFFTAAAFLCSGVEGYADSHRDRFERVERHRIQSLDGSGNNRLDPYRGASGTVYTRVAGSAYADGFSTMAEGPALRYISNRVFADGAQNLFSEIGTTQWVYNWAQFIDHSIGLRDAGTESVEVLFDENDPLEYFTNSAENLRMTRTAVAENTGTFKPREHVNTVSSYIDAWAVYGGTESRLEWLREGPVDLDLSNNKAKLLLTDDGYLPSVGARGDVSSAPEMELVGRLLAGPGAAAEVVVTGDKRANENIALTTVQTLFAREHNRIVSLLPDRLPEQVKFDIARQIVIATQQYITYNEFLPALGLKLSPVNGYNSEVDASVSTEFATVGYRAHSMIHGEIELAVADGTYTDQQLESFRQLGIEVESTGETLELAVPLNVAFANPQLVPQLGLGAIAAGLGSEPQYKNDEQIDNQLRSVLFQLPNPDIANPDACLDGVQMHECFLLAADLGSLDVFRGRDHGIAPYNRLREAYGLRRITSFKDITGEDTDEFPADDPAIDTNAPIDDPDIMEFLELRDNNYNLIPLESDVAQAEAVHGVRRTTLASRLKAIYGNIDDVDAFVGMVSEPHVNGSDLGELQYAMWKQQFEALRDGDSFFYLWNDSLRDIMRRYGRAGVNYRQSLSDIIVNNTAVSSGDIQPNIFLVAEE